MSNIILPRKWTTQPNYPVEIDRNNIYSSGLFLALNFNSGFTVKDRCISTTSGSLDIVDSLDTSRILTGKVSHFGIVNISAIGNYGGIFSVRDSSNNAAFSVYRQSTSNAIVVSQGNISGCGTWSNTLYNNLVVSKQLTYLAYSEGGAAGNKVRLSVARTTSEFTRINDGTAPPGTQAGAGVSLRFLGGRDTATAASGKYILHYGWNREVSTNEYLGLIENPWQIFKPRKQVLYFTTAGGLPTLSAIAASNLTTTGARLTVSA